MRFMFLSESGNGLGLALRLKERGHSVGVRLKDRRSQLNYDGLLHKPVDWQGEFLTKDTIIVFDSNGGGKTGDRLRAQGYAVFVGSTIADQLEYHKDVATAFMEQVGIKLPHYETFYDWEEARSFIKRNEQRWVFKASGELVKDHAIHSYVASDAEDMIRMLDYYQSVTTKKPDFQLQEFVDGVTVSTEGWFNGHEFLYPFLHSVERNQLMNDNLGPSGDSAGSLVWSWTRGTSPVIEEGVARLAPILEEYEYIGPIGLNTVVNEQGVWGLGLTPRFDSSSLPAILELYEGDLGELLASLARGERPKDWRLKSGYGSAVRLSVPPYPSEQFGHEGRVPIRGLEKEDRPHLYFYDVMLDEQNHLVTSPAYGSVLTATGYDQSPEAALEVPYSLLQKAKVPQKQYRTDLRQVLAEDIARFESHLQYKAKGQPVPLNVQA